MTVSVNIMVKVYLLQLSFPMGGSGRVRQIFPLVAGYGLGIVHFSPDLLNGLTIYGYAGDAPGYAAGSMYLADYNICLGIADNTEEGDAMWIINDILKIIVDHAE